MDGPISQSVSQSTKQEGPLRCLPLRRVSECRGELPCATTCIRPTSHSHTHTHTRNPTPPIYIRHTDRQTTNQTTERPNERTNESASLPPSFHKPTMHTAAMQAAAIREMSWRPPIVCLSVCLFV
uniref:Uncharacterized protein n=1 Tax=Vitrella brassicaformis TaxID=1169539 RepID=A0A7S1P3R3_9ALVE